MKTKQAPNRFWVVIRTFSLVGETTIHAQHAPTVVHKTLKSAQDEASRLAFKHPTNDFAIMRAVEIRRTATPEVETITIK